MHKIMQIFVFDLLCNQQNDPWSFFSGSSKLSGAIPAVIFGGIAPIANVVCARPSTEVECVFVHFPISSNFCEKCSTIQAFALVVPSPGRQEWVTWVHGKNPASVRSVQSETKKKLADAWSSRENKKTGNDRQLFSPCAHQLCSLTSKCKNRYILLCTLYPIYLYM